MNIRDEIRKDFQGLSKDQILNKFIELGFNVTEGSGQINIVEEVFEDEFIFELTTVYSHQQFELNKGERFSLKLSPAC